MQIKAKNVILTILPKSKIVQVSKIHDTPEQAGYVEEVELTFEDVSAIVEAMMYGKS